MGIARTQVKQYPAQQSVSARSQDKYLHVAIPGKQPGVRKRGALRDCAQRGTGTVAAPRYSCEPVFSQIPLRPALVPFGTGHRRGANLADIARRRSFAGPCTFLYNTMYPPLPMSLPPPPLPTIRILLSILRRDFVYMPSCLSRPKLWQYEFRLGLPSRTLYNQDSACTSPPAPKGQNLVSANLPESLDTRQVCRNAESIPRDSPERRNHDPTSFGARRASQLCLAGCVCREFCKLQARSR
ncbi:hypothetical protein B0H17DRAFT_546608 [Mycena rosella]|uniref:Uncharacterized protein n=1 Tax=Mycena rosella TaxID=1033263 RepID=A0AAD7GFE8_MYCRO|nr:hypothetical protein B0H17DRAFT_546608 [Mycena rosella]